MLAVISYKPGCFLEGVWPWKGSRREKHASKKKKRKSGLCIGLVSPIPAQKERLRFDLRCLQRSGCSVLFYFLCSAKLYFRLEDGHFKLHNAGHYATDAGLVLREGNWESLYRYSLTD